MFKRYSMFIICETLFTSLIGCTTNNSDTTAKNKIPLTSYITEELQNAFPIGMHFNEYISKT